MWPVLLDLGGTIIYSYPLFIGLAWGVGFRLAEARLPQGIPHRQFCWWMVGLFISSWIGAKVLFMLTQDRWSVGELAQASNFWLGGGFVFLGGLLGGGLFSLIMGLVSPVFKVDRMSFTLIPLLWSHAIGRVGCFLAGCCYGIESHLPWAVEMHGSHRHPVQLYEALGLALLAWWLGRRQKTWLTVSYLAGYGLLRWGVEWFRGDEIRGGFLGQSSSQWISLAMITLAVGLVLNAKVLRKT